jgi:hypothetical protein
MATNTRVLEPSGMVMPPGTKPGAETQFAPTDTNQLPSDVAPPPNATTSNTQGPSSRATITPLAPERYRIQFTAGVGTYQKLIRARDLLRHQVPDGNPVVIFDRALTTLIIEIEKRRFAETLRPRRPIVAGRAVRRPAAGGAWRLTRHIPAEVKRLVWKRDAGRCAFVFPDGNRCEEEGWLEYHHLQPFSLGGEATVDNLELRCRSHNQYEADLVFKPPVRLVEKG